MKLKVVLLFLSLIFCLLPVCAQERPVIGLSDMYKEGWSKVPRSYIDAVLHLEGIPVIVPLMDEEEKIKELLKSLDGVIFTGGEDFDPAYYNENPIPQMGKINAPRDTFDIKLLRLAVQHGIPVLGICRGIQLINIAYGGSLYQDIPAQHFEQTVKHRQKRPKTVATHAVQVQDSTVFAEIVGRKTIQVNSVHHQAVKKVADGFQISGTSPDKIVEVIEKVDSSNWIIGVQFHPEARVEKDTAMFNLFRSFIDEACRLKR